MTEVFVHQLSRKPVVARGHRCVSSEDVASDRRFPRRLERKPLLGHQRPNALQSLEGGVPLVYMTDTWAYIESLQRPLAADAQQDFLTNSHFGVAAVENGSDLAVSALVLLDVGIEQIERDPSDIDRPDLGVDRPVRTGHLDDERSSGRCRHQLHWHLVEVALRVELGLPAVRIQYLFEVPLAIEQPHADEWQSQIAGGFQVIACEDAEPARVDWERLHQTEFEREIGDIERAAGVKLLEP